MTKIFRLLVDTKVFYLNETFGLPENGLFGGLREGYYEKHYYDNLSTQWFWRVDGMSLLPVVNENQAANLDHLFEGYNNNTL